MSYAKSDYKKAIDNAKDEAEALPARYLHAGLCEGQEKYQEACICRWYLSNGRISDIDEKNPIVYLKLAELYEKTEGIIASIEILERGLKEQQFKDFEEILAGYYIRNSQPDKALNLTQNDLTKAGILKMAEQPDVMLENENAEEAFEIREKDDITHEEK